MTMASTLQQELELLHEFELEGEMEGEGEFELHELHEMEGEGEFELHELHEMEGEGEFELHELHELEGEGELELEGEISPVRKIYADAMMEHLAHIAAESETEQEAAEHFLPLIGLAAKKLLPVVAKALGPAVRRALPRIARAVTRVEPRLTRGITRIVRGLHRQPATRRLLHAVPAIARRTVHTIARQAASGRAVTPRAAIRTLSNQARWVLGNRVNRLRALRRSGVMDRRFHRHHGPGVVRPHWHTGYPTSYPAYAPGVATYAAPVPRRVATGMPAGRPVVTGTAAVGGCPACPRCNGQVSVTPAYCRCCGQVLR
jgi:hypothetical protein